MFLKTVTIGAGSVAAGCSSGNSHGGITLTQWYHQYGEAGTEQAVIRYAQEFTKAYPHIRIKVVWVPGDYKTKLATALLVPGGPDVFESSLTLPMAQAAQVAPLDDLFTPAVRADFSPRDLEANTVGNTLYGVKMLDDTGILYFRKSLLAAAGVAPPTTMDELIAAARKLNTPNRKGLFLGNDGGVTSMLNVLPWSAGSDFLKGSQIVFDNDRTVEAYEKLKELNDSGALLIGAPTDWWDPSALIQGMAAMQWTGLWAYPAIRRALGDDVGGMAWPALDAQGSPATFLGGWTSMVNAQGHHIPESKELVKWLWIQNTAIQRDWCLSYGFHVPPRKTVAATAAALKAPIPARAVRDLSEHGHALPPAWSSSMNTILTDAVSGILKQGHSGVAAVKTASQLCQRELDRLLV